VIEDLRLCIYRSFADTGALPRVETLIEIAGGEAALGAGIQRLADDRHLALDAQGHIAMAHPFASVSFGYSVMGERTLWWGGCAWDSFALPHLVQTETDVLVATRCPNCDTPLAWVVNRDEPPTGDEIAHFLVPVAKIWDDVIHTCSNQRLFCGNPCIDEWLKRSQLSEGYRMDLATLWRFASRWYEGRLARGYRRRDPTTAKEYFRSVGLRGAFWGLDDTM
jgi:Alkylmercury lyase